MAKEIILTDEKGNEYTLKFTRRSIKRMEQKGFDPSIAEKQPMTTMYELFEGALYAAHPDLKREQIDELFEGLDDLNAWMDDLSELYQDKYTTSAGEMKRTKNW